MLRRVRLSCDYSALLFRTTPTTPLDPLSLTKPTPPFRPASASSDFDIEISLGKRSATDTLLQTPLSTPANRRQTHLTLVQGSTR